jgi:anti-sigma regulatory factor (Ser/Thr protein kinase)
MMRESWLPAAPESATQARALVRAAASELGLDGAAAWDLQLATTEAVANAVEHGCGCVHAGNGIRLCIEAHDGALHVEVCDCGTFRAPTAPMDPMAQGGRGIPLIAAVVDQVELLAGGQETRVRFTKRLATA